MRHWLRIGSGDGRVHGRVLVCALFLCAPFAWSGKACAEPAQAVVEVFTSQGCGPCRAADPVIHDLSRRPGIVALTLPVTYWDYIGWKDTLASRAFDERQYAYARVRGGRQLFTPQAIIDGYAVAVGSDRHAVDRLIREASRHGGLPVPVRGEEQGGHILVEVGAGTAPAGTAAAGEVYLVPVLRSRAVAIQGGENGGRTETYVNVARALQRLGPWTGEPAHFDVPSAQAEVGGADGWVVVVQGGEAGRPGRILGAAKGPGL